MDHLALVPAYLIIGAGAFGASTALALKKAMPNLPITLIDSVDFPDPSIGSFDYDKLVRADYDDPLYLAMALRAQYQWRTNPLYSQFYHESGMVNIEETGQGRRMINNYALWRVPTGATVVSPEQLRAHYPIFQDTDYTDVKEIFVNPESGWVEAKPALTAVIKAAINLGVNYIQGTVMKIFFDSAGDCAGARLVDGTIIDAVKVIMSTGAWTAKLLADSTQGDPTLQVHDRMDAAAVVVGTIQLTPSQLETYKDMPVLVHKKEGVSGK